MKVGNYSREDLYRVDGAFITSKNVKIQLNRYVKKISKRDSDIIISLKNKYENNFT